jgi:hypothetical protein
MVKITVKDTGFLPSMGFFNHESLPGRNIRNPKNYPRSCLHPVWV